MPVDREGHQFLVFGGGHWHGWRNAVLAWLHAAFMGCEALDMAAGLHSPVPGSWTTHDMANVPNNNGFETSGAMRKLFLPAQLGALAWADWRFIRPVAPPPAVDSPGAEAPGSDATASQ